MQEEHIIQLFAAGRHMVLRQAAYELQAIAKIRRSAAYDALKVNWARFSHLLERDPDTDLIGLRADANPGDGHEADPDGTR